MHCKDAELSFNWVKTNVELCAAVSLWKSESVLGIDTEFKRVNTFYPIPALYQVAVGNDVFLIDPITITDWSAFAEILINPGILKILHSCGEDLELFSHHLGVTPANLFDTQLANAFQDTNPSVSYAAIVKNVCGIELAKSSTRSDWLKRPLTETQINYAIEDVLYLERLYHALNDRLVALDRIGWFKELMHQRINNVRPLPEDYYRTIKKAWALTPVQLDCLRRLVTWREKTAMNEDVPRKFILQDDHLYEIARSNNLDRKLLKKNLPKWLNQSYLDEFVGLYKNGVNLDKTLEPIPKPLSRGEAKLAKSLKFVCDEIADVLGMAKELIGTKKDTEHCVRYFKLNRKLPEMYLGWRFSFVGEKFNSILGEESGPKGDRV